MTNPSRKQPNQHVNPNREGIYQVRPERALHWVDRKGNQSLWAGPRSFVRLDSRLSQFCQQTGQMHKLLPVAEEDLPEGATVLYDETAPRAVRDELRAARGEMQGEDFEKVKKPSGAKSKLGAEDPDKKPAAKKEPEPEPESDPESAPEPEKKASTGSSAATPKGKA